MLGAAASIAVSKTADGGASPSASVASLAPPRWWRRCSSQACFAGPSCNGSTEGFGPSGRRSKRRGPIAGKPLLSSRLTPCPGFHWRFAKRYCAGLWIRIRKVRLLQRLSWCYGETVITGACHASVQSSTLCNTVLERWPSLAEGSCLLSSRGLSLSGGSNPPLSVPHPLLAVSNC